MWLEQLVDEHESADSRLVVVADAADAVADDVDRLGEYFRRFNVTVEAAVGCPAGVDPYVVLESDGTCHAGVDLDLLCEYLFERRREAFAGGEFPDAGVVSALLTHLDDQLYSLDRTDRLPLLNVSHTIESRAMRAGDGQLHAGFQRLSRLGETERTWDDYVRMAEAGVETHVYGVPDWEPPGAGSDRLTVHEDHDGLLADLWFVAFDGATDDDPAALLARQDGDRYRGFWTFQPGLVADIVDHLRTDVVPQMS